MAKISKEEEVIAVMSGQQKCYWCGGYFAPDGTYADHICGPKCSAEEYNKWCRDNENWRSRVRRNGAPEDWIGL
jgi:hypothetical protein